MDPSLKNFEFAKNDHMQMALSLQIMASRASSFMHKVKFLLTYIYTLKFFLLELKKIIYSHIFLHYFFV